MKRQIIIAVVALGAFVFGINNAQAQTTSIITGIPTDPVSTTVNIKLKDVISIEQGAGDASEVNFYYNYTSDYNSLKTIDKTNSLIITSSRNFDVNVKAPTGIFTGPTETIPLNVLDIQAAGVGIENQDAITLSIGDEKLVSNANKGAQISLDLSYSISAEKARAELLGMAPENYTTEVLYTATAR